MITSVATVLKRLVGIKAVPTWSLQTEVGRNIVRYTINNLGHNVLRDTLRLSGELTMPKDAKAVPVSNGQFEGFWYGRHRYDDPDVAVIFFIHGTAPAPCRLPCGAWCSR